MDKSMRSVFVGNIPYDATEDALKDVFTEVGPVLSMKLVYDRESGKPKGYGFCEYKDQETALSAMRNLNGYVFGGRALRVDNACTEKSRMEMAALLQLPHTDSPYGDQCEPDAAPEVITKMVASFPPERVHEVLEQLQNAARRDPIETRETLLKNPQLCYAALQMLVMRGVLDPAAAVNFLLPCNQPKHGFPSGMLSAGGGDSRMSVDMHVPAMDPRFGRYGHQPQQQLHPPQGPPMGPSAFPVDPRHRMNNDPRMDRPFGNFGVAPSGPPGSVAGPGLPVGLGATALPANLPNIGPHGMHLDAGGGGDVSDQEKATLIMQVLQLSDEQIALLPPEQRASILVLKEQLLRNSQR